MYRQQRLLPAEKHCGSGVRAALACNFQSTCRAQLDLLCWQHGYALRRSVAEDAEAVAPFVSAEEVLELWHLHGIVDAGVVLRHALQTMESAARFGAQKQHGGMLWTLHGQEGALGIGGITPLGNDSLAARVWFLGRDLQSHARFLSRASKLVLAWCLQQYPLIGNRIGVWNTKGISWLKHAGFTVEDTPEQVGGAKFFRFWAARANP